MTFMEKFQHRIVVFFVFVITVGLAFGIMKFLIAQKEEPPARRLSEITRYLEVDIIDYMAVLSPVEEPGRMSSVSEINVSAEASGKVEQGDIPLKEGAAFKKGAILFSIYKDEAVLALKAKKSQFMNSLALLLPDIAIDYPEQEKTFTSFFNAVDINNPLPAFPEVKDEKLTIFLAGKNILSDYYSILKDELQLSRYVIRAPFDGTLTSVNMEVGAYANAGSIIAKAIRTDPLELDVPLRLSDALWVKIGDPVQLSSEAHSATWQGKVIRKGQVVEENTQSQHVYVEVSNHGKQALLAGEFITATFPGRPVQDVMEIPRNAVFNSNEVFIVKDHRLKKQQINIVKVNTNTLLFNGLTQGDTIVVQPLINVYEGTRVTTSLDEQKMVNPEKPGQETGNSNQKEKGSLKKRDK